MGKVIAVASWKGGTGKTTAIAAISSCLAVLGFKTLCVDFDTKLNNLDLALGMAAPALPESIETPDEKPEAIKAHREHPKIQNLFFLSSAPVNSLDDLDIADSMPMFDDFRSDYDYCLIDTPTGSGAGFRLSHANADMSIIVSNGEIAALMDAQKAASAVLDSGAHDIRLLVNHVVSSDFSRIYKDITGVTETSGAQLIGIIPEDYAIYHALRENIPLILYDKPLAAYHYLDVARRITGETLPWRKLVSRPEPSGILHIREPDSRDELTEEMKEFYGDPESWAKSTLLQDDLNDLVKVHTVKPGLYVSAETIRQRMWLHDILDDRGIQYHIEFIGYWANRRKFVEAQNIYVKKEYEVRVRFLIKDYRSTSNIIQEDLEERNQIVSFDEGIPQKPCPSCGKEIDFDFVTCPYCKKQI